MGRTPPGILIVRGDLAMEADPGDWPKRRRKSSGSMKLYTCQ
jgi:hypothetical protein